jgi:hypothetical protein
MKPKRKKIVAWAIRDHTGAHWVYSDKEDALAFKEGKDKIIKLVEHDAKRGQLIKDLIRNLRCENRNGTWLAAIALEEHEKGTK